MGGSAGFEPQRHLVAREAVLGLSRSATWWRGRQCWVRDAASSGGMGGSVGFEPQRHLGVVQASVAWEAVLGSSRSAN